jgi:hypothetical protein
VTGLKLPFSVECAKYDWLRWKPEVLALTERLHRTLFNNMIFLTRLLVLLAILRPFVLAYPWMAGEGLQSKLYATRHHSSESRLISWAARLPVPKPEAKRQLLGPLLKPITETVGNTLGGLAGPGGLLEGLLGSLGSASVRGEDKRPDAAHPFQVGRIAGCDYGH